MTFRSFASDLCGVLLVFAAFAWIGFDASQHAGRIALVTGVGALGTAATGGWLISKSKTLALFDFLFEQAKRLGSIKLPSAGSGSDA